MDELSRAVRAQLIALFQRHGLAYNDADENDVEALHARIAEVFAAWMPVAAVQAMLPNLVAPSQRMADI
jgi:hypothetical protein